jgi:hypothetical protein
MADPGRNSALRYTTRTRSSASNIPPAIPISRVCAFVPTLRLDGALDSDRPGRERQGLSLPAPGGVC